MRPQIIDSIVTETQALGFPMASEDETGQLLRTLASSKNGGRLLELGTGTGIGTAWILDGMDAKSSLVTIDNEAKVLKVARRFLQADSRVTILEEDGARFIERMAGQRFDFIFADTWPGKFTHLEETLALLAPGGLYIIDDLLPQESWPVDHAPKVPRLIAALTGNPSLHVTYSDHGTGIIIASKRG